MQKISSEQYLRNYVRDEDYNLYLLHFFVPRIHRPAFLSLMGLHCELRSIPKKVQDPMMMLIRLQWWRDELAKDNHADSPILHELSSCGLTTGSRDNNLQDPPIKSEDDTLLNDYLNRFEQSLRGEQVDIDEAFYALMTSIIKNQKAKNRFSKKLILHDMLEEQNSKFHAVRLWLGV